MELAAGTLVGRYEIQSPLGAGGMGAVYLAHDTRLRRPVALKLLSAQVAADPQLLARFRREAQIVVALNHPNVVTVYDAGELDGLAYLATELVLGVNLRQRMAAGPFSVAELLRIGAQVAAALGAAHAAGIVHRDVKPENVMLRNDGYVKVLDFGVAKLVEGSPALRAADHVTREESMVGTVAYMSPEQLRGEPVDARSDLWSLGVLLHELATGVVPFSGRTVSGVIAAILTAPVPHASAVATMVPPALDAILDRALERDVARRYASAAAIAADLDALRVELAAAGSRASGAELRFTGGGPQQATQVLGRPPAAAKDSDSAPWTEIASALGAPAPAEPRRHNLPAPTTSFHGREEQLATVLATLRRDDVRLLVLLGPGGAGKTRLAIEAARSLVDDFADGVIMVPLAATSDAEALPGDIADVLAVKELGDRPSLAALAEWLAPRRMLLLLDNLEQVGARGDGPGASAGSILARLLEAAPGLRLLVTSREVLHVRGEHDLPLPPLAVPQAGASTAPDDLAEVPAVALFLARAQAVEPAFRLDARNAAAVGELCRRLDGLPLAIELAAARVRVLPPEEMLARLGDRFRLLAAGAADLPDRHRTLRATLDWGYDLLSEAERRAFRALGVFRGSFSADAVAQVCMAPDADDLDALETIGSLLDKSLLQKRDPPQRRAPAAGSARARQPSPPRFALLESVRDYARSRQPPEETRSLRQRHARYFLALAERGIPDLAPAAPDVPLTELVAAEEDLREALAWAFEQDDPEPALRLTGSLWWFWYLHGQYREGRAWAERALERGRGVLSVARARTLLGNGMLAYLQCDYAAAEAMLGQSGELASELGERRVLAATLQFSGSVARERGDYDRATTLHGDSLAVWRELGDERGVARSTNYLAFVAWLRGDLDLAARHAEDAYQRFRALDDREGLAWSLLNKAAIGCYRHQLAVARDAAREALALATDAGYKEGLAWALNLLGAIALRDGRSGQARALLRRALEMHRDLGDRWRMASVLELLAAVARARGDLERGVRLDAGATAVRRALGTPQPPAEARELAEQKRAAEASLGEERVRALVAQVDGMRTEQVVAGE